MARKIITWAVLVGMTLLLLFAYLGKNTLNKYLSEQMKLQVEPETILSAEGLINLNYNYVKNGQLFEYTLLEFGSTGCTVCKQMEPVLDEIRNLPNPRIKVDFLNIMKPENLSLMKFYGILAVPMQILLDSQGKEFFRHYGFIATSELENMFITAVENR